MQVDELEVGNYINYNEGALTYRSHTLHAACTKEVLASVRHDARVPDALQMLA